MKVVKNARKISGMFFRKKIHNFLCPYLIAHVATDPRNTGTLCITTILAADEKEALENLQRTRKLFPDAVLIDLGQSDLSVCEKISMK